MESTPVISEVTAHLNAENFLKDFHRTAQFGATSGGGIDRQAGTREHGAVRDWFCERARELGFELRVDEIGNLFALLTWTPGAPYVLMGSHLDSQPLGGRFDGTYGVIAALHAAAAAGSAAQMEGISPEFNLAVVDWFNEEGARFAPSVMGSSVFAGHFDLETTLATEDPAGVTVEAALRSIGYLGEGFRPEAAAYLEVHIEQGRRLERSGVPIGVVETSWHTQKLMVQVVGEQSHTGATLMADRHDALAAAAEVVLAAEGVVDEFPAESIVTSVGRLDVLPNSPIVVPRQVDMVVDLRADKPERVHKARRDLLDRFERIAVNRGVEILAEDFDIRPMQPFPRESVDLGGKAAADVGVESVALATLAGHDSVAMNRIIPSVMLFVPSQGGVSHCEREFTSDADLVTGLEVLTEALRRVMGGELNGVSPGGTQP